MPAEDILPGGLSCGELSRTVICTYKRGLAVFNGSGRCTQGQFIATGGRSAGIAVRSGSLVYSASEWATTALL